MLPEIIMDSMKEFANRFSKIHSLYKGTCPISKDETYYFLYEGKYDFGIEETAVELEIAIYEIFDYDFRLSSLPVSLKNAEKVKFLEECINFE